MIKNGFQNSIEIKNKKMKTLMLQLLAIFGNTVGI